MPHSFFDTQPIARWVPCGGLRMSLKRLIHIPLRLGLPFKKWWSKNKSAAHFRRLYDSTILNALQTDRLQMSPVTVPDDAARDIVS